MSASDRRDARTADCGSFGAATVVDDDPGDLRPDPAWLCAADTIERMILRHIPHCPVGGKTDVGLHAKRQMARLAA